MTGKIPQVGEIWLWTSADLMEQALYVVVGVGYDCVSFMALGLIPDESQDGTPGRVFDYPYKEFLLYRTRWTRPA